jgi:ribokinase
VRIAVIGHVEHVTVGRVARVPGPGEIAHLEGPRWFPGGGGGVTFFQLCRSDAQLLLYTALGNDEAAREVEERLRSTHALLHCARRAEPHTRDVVLIPPGGDRTIVVVGEPLHPRRSDALAWEELAGCDAAYFTAQDPLALQAARAARLLVVSARRREALQRSGVRADLVIGSALDPREASTLADYAVRPGALVMTEGARGGTVETAAGRERFAAPAEALDGGGAYGAGDSFAGALVYFLATGLPLLAACERAGEHGAAVLAGIDPLENQKPLSLERAGR